MTQQGNHSLFVILLLVSFATQSQADDWPMWRYDSSHTAASPHRLPEKLELEWVRQFSPREQAWDDPLNNDLMTYDKTFEPIVMDGRMFLSFNDSDKVVALDVQTGRELWTFFTDGPVRLPPVGWNEKIYFTSDDGYFYCLRAIDGSLYWKRRGGPSSRKVLGNKRLVSSWPARGGAVVRDGVVYFAASIWPFMGTFIYALDAENGDVVWVNDGSGSEYISQPHGAPAFAGVAPQGVLVATEEILLVPGGRSMPAAFDRQTGKPLYFRHGGKGNGGSFVVANEKECFIHTRYRGVRAWALEAGTMSTFTLNEPVLAGEIIYTAAEKDGRQLIQAFTEKKKELWNIEADGRGDLIKTGERLYAAGKEMITAIELPNGDDGPRVVWSHPVEGGVLRLLAANEKLFAVTLDGRIMAFGDSRRSARTGEQEKVEIPKPAANQVERVRALLERADVAEGYALWYGMDDLDLLLALLSETKLHVIVVAEDREKVARLRAHFDAFGWYGQRVTCHVGDPVSFAAPPYIAHLVVVDSSLVSHSGDDRFLSAIYKSVRPYGGTLWFPSLSEAAGTRLARQIESRKLEQSEALASQNGLYLFRRGALPGSADWTHQYGNIANTVKSDDRRVKLPLGVLWFGGNSNLDVLPRHGHGPTEQVVGGRLFIEGMDSISARDVYTGRVIWKTHFPNLGTFGAYFNESYKETPLSTERNQQHLPGANARGTNFIATTEAVYVVQGSKCHIVDAKTGEETGTISMPNFPGHSEAPHWGYIGIYRDVLLGGWDFAALESGGSPVGKLSIADMSSSKGLVAFDRHTGQILWKATARYSFLHNGIIAGGGRVYVLDRLPQAVENKQKRRGLSPPADYRIVSFDAHTGRPLWQKESGLFGTWLGYSEPRDILLLAGAKGVDRQEDDEVGQGMATFRGRDGEPLWSHKLKYAGPCILYNDTIITNVIRYSVSSGAFNLLDGSPQLITNPLTGQQETWRISRTYGCDSMTACENFLTFRSGAAGYYDLLNKSGTGNLGGFKSSCSGNLIAANGVLNAPDYTRTCSCSYQNQTSLGMIYAPEMETWSNSEIGAGSEPGTRIERVGLNFGAPGDRRDENGTLWVDVPSVGGSSPGIEVSAQGKGLEYFRRHSSIVKGKGPAWVAASGARNVQSLAIRLQTLRHEYADGGLPIVDGGDDAEEFDDGRVALSEAELELGEQDRSQIVGLRFRNLKLTPDMPIEKALIQFKVDERSLRPTRLTIHAEGVGNTREFGTAPFDLSSRAKTDHKVVWTVPEWTKAGRDRPAQQTPDLAELIREVIHRPDWKAGNAIAFFIQGDGQRVVESFEGNPTGAARLIITSNGKTIRGEAEPLPELSERPHTVRLYFCEPDAVKPGERVFDLLLQGNRVLANYDIVKEAGGRNGSSVVEFPHVPIGSVLNIAFEPTTGATKGPVVSGVEIVAE